VSLRLFQTLDRTLQIDNLNTESAVNREILDGKEQQVVDEGRSEHQLDE